MKPRAELAHGTSKRAEFLRRLDELIAWTEANVFYGRRPALIVLRQVRRQRSLNDRRRP